MLSGLMKFLLRGDVITLAVAVIIGGAFQAIIDSLVNDLISPIIALVTGGTDLTKEFVYGADANGEGGFRLGSFLNAILKFFIVGTTLYILIKAAGKSEEEVK